MTLIVLGAGKGSPGVTTAALALSAAWPGDVRPLVWEADGQGGDLQLRFGLPEEPGLVTLAGQARPVGLTARLAAEHTVRLPGGVPVIAAPRQAAAAKAALTALAPLWGEAESGPVPWLVDAGRLDLGSDTELKVVRAAQVFVLVARGSAEALTHAAEIADQVGMERVPVVLAVVGDSPYGDEEISQALRVDLCVRLPHDLVTAGLLSGGALPARRHARRSYPLLAAARTLATTVQAQLPAGHTDTSLHGAAGELLPEPSGQGLQEPAGADQGGSW